MPWGMGHIGPIMTRDRILSLFRPNNFDAKRSLVSSSKLPYRPIDNQLTAFKMIANENDRYKRNKKY